MKRQPDEQKEENARLRAERDLAFRELSSLRKSIEQLSGMVASQNDRLDQLVSMLRRREEQLRRKEGEVRKLRRQLGLDDPEPEPDAVPMPEGAPAEGAPDPAAGSESAGTSTPSTSPGSEGSSGGDGPAPETPATERGKRPRSRGGRRPPPAHLPVDQERHNVCACGKCGGRVIKRDLLTIEIYTVVPTYVRRRQIERERVICAACGEPTTAPMPPMPCERALYDCRFLAWLVVLKFALLVPLDRIRTLLLTQGVDIAMGTLVHLIERAADLAGAIDGEHLKQLKAGTYMHFDGTGLKALVLGQCKAWDGYLEVFTRDELTVFQFDLTKHADRLRARMNGFLGILICDAETRNSAGAPGLKLANCNAHPLRGFQDAERAQPRLAVQGARFLQALYDLEDQADLMGLRGQQRTEFRQRRSRRVLRRFRQWLDGVIASDLPPSDPVRKLATYYVKHFDDLTRFVDDGDLPIDNNAAEREFQRHAKLRQASLFAGSPEGGHRWATLLGIVRTAQKCEVDVLAYLTWMFERRGTYRARFGLTASELTPMAYRDLVKAKAAALAA
jgi:transposase